MSERTPLEQRMLSGERFTYSGLCAAFNPAEQTSGERGGRTVDKTIQKFRRKGWIEIVERSRLTYWCATAAGKAALSEQG